MKPLLTRPSSELSVMLERNYLHLHWTNVIHDFLLYFQVSANFSDKRELLPTFDDVSLVIWQPSLPQKKLE